VVFLSPSDQPFRICLWHAQHDAHTALGHDFVHRPVTRTTVPGGAQEKQSASQLLPLSNKKIEMRQVSPLQQLHQAGGARHSLLLIRHTRVPQEEPEPRGTHSG